MKYSIVTRIYTEILINQAVDNFTSSRFRESRHKGSIRLSCLILQQLAEYAKTHFHDDFPRRRLLDMSLRLMSSRQMTLYRFASFLLSLCQKSKRWLWIFWLSFWTCSFSFHRLCESFSFRLIWCCSFASLFCD